MVLFVFCFVLFFLLLSIYCQKLFNMILPNLGQEIANMIFEYIVLFIYKERKKGRKKERKRITSFVLIDFVLHV